MKLSSLRLEVSTNDLRSGELSGHVSERVNYSEEEFGVIFVFVCCGEETLCFGVGLNGWARGDK